jgi:4-hydroxyphenylacetate 3-monooxygenase
MPIRTGQQFLEALKDDRRIFMDGDEIRDIAHDPRTAGAARTLAELYDMQHDPALAEQMTFASPSSGKPVGLSFIEPRTVEDLIRRRGMIKLWMDATCGMFGRSPDFLNVMLTGLAAAAAEFGGNDPRFAANIRDYQIHAREHDLCLTHTLLNPQVDRSRPVERQEKDLAAKIVKETDAGIIVTGARMVATLCAYSDDLLVLPSTFLATNLEAAPFDEGDGLAVFDNVLVPWERVFIHRDPEMCNGLFQRTGAMPQVMHQTSTKNLAKAEFMLALGCAIARSTNIDTHLHVQGMLAELIEHVEFARLHPRQRGRRRAAPRLGADDPGRDAAVDGADDVPKDVRARLRNHPAARRRRARCGAFICRIVRSRGRRCRKIRAGRQRQRRRSDPRQIIPPRLRRRAVVLLGPSAAL